MASCECESEEFLVLTALLEDAENIRKTRKWVHEINMVRRKEDDIQKQCTNYREPIEPVERLTVTLRFLATGDSFSTIGHSFRMGFSTVFFLDAFFSDLFEGIHIFWWLKCGLPRRSLIPGESVAPTPALMKTARQ
ncbi:hypothetical protein MTP99_006891 [Tenebrio molitor]|nr:hypothetical protein MTP99_006891 [Tenebrio molitor]